MIPDSSFGISRGVTETRRKGREGRAPSRPSAGCRMSPVVRAGACPHAPCGNGRDKARFLSHAEAQGATPHTFVPFVLFVAKTNGRTRTGIANARLGLEVRKRKRGASVLVCGSFVNRRHLFVVPCCPCCRFYLTRRYRDAEERTGGARLVAPLPTILHSSFFSFSPCPVPRFRLLFTSFGGGSHAECQFSQTGRNRVSRGFILFLGCIG